MKILNNDTYLLLIDEEAEIKGGPFLCYNPLKITWDDDVVLYQGAMPEYNYRGLQKIIAYYPLNSEAKELDLPLLPNPFKEEVNIEKLAISSFGYKPTKVDNSIILSLSKGYIRGFQDGYKAATKQFSLEDMKKAIEMARIGFKNYPSDSFKSINNYIKSETNKIIQSLSTQQFPSEFIPEYEIVPDQNNYGSGEIFSTNMKEVLKTITNSEGKEVLVGTYKY